MMVENLTNLSARPAPAIDSLHPDWLRIAARLEKCVSLNGYKGYAMVSISVMVDPRGNPKFWFEPEFRRIEPKYADVFRAIADAASAAGSGG